MWDWKFTCRNFVMRQIPRWRKISGPGVGGKAGPRLNAEAAVSREKSEKYQQPTRARHLRGGGRGVVSPGKPTFAKSLANRNDASRPVHLSSVIQKKQSEVSTFSSTKTCATPSGCRTCGCVGRIRRLGKRVQCRCRDTLEAASSIAVLVFEWPSNTWDAD